MSQSDTASFTDLIKEEVFEEPAALLAAFGAERFRHSRWVFRGQPNAAWALEPTLERLARSLGMVDIQYMIEKPTIREFRRRAHHYVRDLPDEGNLPEWLALMRHYGAPTRLLDFTKSPYIAAFFATAEAQRGEASAIWAVDSSALTNYSALILSKEMSLQYRQLGEAFIKTPSTSFATPENFDVLTSNMGPFPQVVVPIEPFRINERMLVQRGLFLAQAAVIGPFETSLRNVLQFAHDDPARREPMMSKIVIQPKVHRYVLRELHRMNLSYATLFPGLDGLARSLATVARIRETGSPPGHPPMWDPEVTL